MGITDSSFKCLSCDEVYLDKDRVVLKYKYADDNEGPKVPIDICKYCKKGPSTSLINHHSTKFGMYRTYAKYPPNQWEVDYNQVISDPLVFECVGVSASEEEEWPTFGEKRAQKEVNEVAWSIYMNSVTQCRRTTTVCLECANCRKIENYNFIEDVNSPEGWRKVVTKDGNQLELLRPIFRLSCDCREWKVNINYEFNQPVFNRTTTIQRPNDYHFDATLPRVTGRDNYLDYMWPIFQHKKVGDSLSPNKKCGCPFIDHVHGNREGEVKDYVIEIIYRGDSMNIQTEGQFIGSGYVCGSCSN